VSEHWNCWSCLAVRLQIFEKALLVPFSRCRCLCGVSSLENVPVHGRYETEGSEEEALAVLHLVPEDERG
jgi:hypothetical protein